MEVRILKIDNTNVYLFDDAQVYCDPQDVDQFKTNNTIRQFENKDLLFIGYMIERDGRWCIEF